MKIERDKLFRELTPPAGGAAGMRARLAAEASNATPLASWLFAPAGVAAVLLIAVLVAVALRSGLSIDGGGIAGDDARVQGELYASADLDRLLGRPSTPFELSVTRGDERLELTEIPTRDSQVRIVRIE